MHTIYIVDALNILFRAYYAIGPMTNSHGESTNALYGFIRSINKLISDFSPSHLVIVFDGPDNKRHRSALFADYKSHRKPMPQDLVSQVDRAHQFCQLAGIPMLNVEGVEADDTIASITHWIEENKGKGFICTSDKDLCQLVTDSVKVINLHKENLLVDKDKVKEIYGVRPDQIVDYLAIVGDASDNIPGLEGFGPKTATQLLQEFDNLDNLLANVSQIKSDKRRSAIEEGKEILLLSKQLATVHYNVNVPHDDSFYQLKVPDYTHLKEFYHQMNFNSLLKEVHSKEENIPSQSTPKKIEEGSYHLVNSPEELSQLISYLSSFKEICFDTETSTLHPLQAKIVGIGFSAEPLKAFYIPFNGSLERDLILSSLKELFSNPSLAFFGHNVKYDCHILLNEGLPMPKLSFDTILASYLLDPQKQRHNLDDLCLEFFDKVKIPITDLIGKGKKEISMLEVPIESVCEYCCEDADYTYRLKDLLEGKLSEKGILHILKEIELPLSPVLLYMEREGIFLDESEIRGLSSELAQKISHLEAEIFNLAGETFNINSPKQLVVILFEKLQIPASKKGTTGYSTAADVLEALKDDYPIVKLILEYRVVEKLRSTYTDALVEQILPQTGRIHCTFNQSVAATGRLSCQNPNLQNIPIRSKEGMRIRECFKPQRSGYVFLSADYSQIELRLLAHFSEDPKLLYAFHHNADIHAYTASLVFNVPLEEVTSEMRYKAKAVNFGILYGQQAFGLSQGLSIDYREAKKFIETYFERYSRVKEFIEESKESVRQLGYSKTLTGRQRPIPEILSKNPIVRGAAERLAVNTPLQGTGADLIKMAMISVDHALRSSSLDAKMILQIHDELLFEVHEKDADALGSIVKGLMENVMELKVPLIVDISVGKNWGEC